MAEISVPAWPIPIHQTKLVIAKAQATGILIPHIPTPRYSRYSNSDHKNASSSSETENSPNQKAGVRRVRTTMDDDLLVTEAERHGPRRRREALARFRRRSSSALLVSSHA